MEGGGPSESARRSASDDLNENLTDYLVAVNKVPTRLLSEPVNVRLVVMRADSDNNGNWEWSGASESSSCKVEGHWIQFLDDDPRTQNGGYILLASTKVKWFIS